MDWLIGSWVNLVYLEMLCMIFDILNFGCKHILQYVKYINELTLQKEWLNFITNNACFRQKSKTLQQLK